MKKILFTFCLISFALGMQAKTWNFTNAPFGASPTVSFASTFTTDGLTVGTDGINLWTGLSTSAKIIDGVSYTYRLQTGGGGTPVASSKIPTTRYLKLDVSTNDTLKIGCISSSTSATRTIIIVNSDQSVVDSIVNVSGTTATTYSYVYKGAPSSLYLYSRGGGLNYYYLSLLPSKTFGVYTIGATSNLPTSSTATGVLTALNLSSVLSYGFCWNSAGTPTVKDSKTNKGVGTVYGTYSDNITGLTQGTTYYIRAYAINSTDTIYGTEISITTATIPTSSTVGGNYYTSQYWSKSHSPYTITSNVNIAYEATLTIEPGVVVNYAGKNEIMLMGNIIANGTAADSITFNGYSGGCRYFNFKNSKLSNSELSYIKLIGVVTDSIVTQGTASDSLIVNKSRISNVTIKAINPIYYRNSVINNLSVGSSKTFVEKSSIANSNFGSAYQTIYLKLKKSIGTNLSIYGGDYSSNSIIDVNASTLNNSYFELYSPTLKLINSDINSCNFNWSYGYSTAYLTKSRINKSAFSSVYSSGQLILVIDSTILLNSPVSYSNQVTINNSIFKSDSTEVLNLNGTINKSQFIGDNNHIGGVGLDVATGTMNYCTLVNHRIGIKSNSLTVNNTNFINISKYDVYNTAANQIDAKSNFWGVGNTTIATVKSKIWDYYTDMNLGKVLYDSYITTANITSPITPPLNFRKTKATNGVTYTWNANPESDLKGYKLYYGKKDAFSFTNSIDLGNVTTYTLTGVLASDTVLVTAYDQAADGINDQLEGHESWYSDDYIPVKPTLGATTILAQNTKTCKLQSAVNSLGEAPIRSYGFCWNSKGNPTVSDTLVNKGACTSTATFTDSITHLKINNYYYIRSYATTDYGTFYGSETNFISGGEIIRLGLNDSIHTVLNNYNGISDSLTIIIPAGYTSPEYAAGKNIVLTSIPTAIKKITIQGDGTSPTLLVKQINPPLVSLKSFYLKNLTLKGIEDGASSLTLSNSLLFMAKDTLETISIEGCNIANFSGVVGKATFSKIGNININNCIARGLGASGLISTTSGTIGNIVVRNSTVYGASGNLISNSIAPLSITVSDCTFDQICNTSKYFISATTGVVNLMVLKNIVFGRTLSLSSFGVRVTAKDSVYTNCYVSMDWMNSGYLIPNRNYYYTSSYNLFKSPTSYNLTTNVATVGDYTIIDGNFPGAINAGDPRWYYNGNINSVDENFDTGKMKVYPSLVKELLNVEYDGTCNYQIVDMNGRVWKTGIVMFKNGINTSSLPQGMYIINLQKEHSAKAFKFNKI